MKIDEGTRIDCARALSAAKTPATNVVKLCLASNRNIARIDLSLIDDPEMVT